MSKHDRMDPDGVSATGCGMTMLLRICLSMRMAAGNSNHFRSRC